MSRLLGWIVNVLVVRPLAVVTRLLEPRRRRDPRIERLNSLRTWAGFLALAVIVHANLTDPDLHGTVIGFLNSPYLKVALAVGCFVPAGAVLVVKADPGQRVRVAGAAAKPLFIALAVTITPLAIIALAGWRYRDSAAMNGLDGLWFLLIVVAGLSLLPAALWSVFLGVKYQFRASDVHPFLPALVAGFVAVVTSTTSVVQLFGRQTTLDRFVSLSSFCGGLVVLMSSLYEIRLLQGMGFVWNRDHGIGANAALLATGVEPGEWAPRLVIPLLMVLFSSSVHALVPAAMTTPSPEPPNPITRSVTTDSPTRSRSSAPSPPTPRPVPLHPVSFDVPATAPDNADAAGHRVSFGAGNLGDGRLETAWRAPGDLTGRKIVIRFRSPVTITSVGLVPGYAKTDPATGESRFTENRRISSVLWSAAGSRPVAQRFRSTPNMQTQRVHLTTSTLTLTITGTTTPGDRDFTAISEIQLSGFRP